VSEMRLVHSLDAHVDVLWGDQLLLRYVHRPATPQLESPKPYLHPLHTLGGDLVTAYRPWDHIWHKGISLALPHVGPENFWGGVTFLRDRGYEQLDNNGAMRHVAFDRLSAGDGRARIDERLEWITQAGEHWFDEQRSLRATVMEDAWVLSFGSAIVNRSGRDLAFGSPTTNGRPDAGYGGLLWRGPRSFTGGDVLTPDGVVAEESAMGDRGPWLAFVGRQDGTLHPNTLAFFDDPANPVVPTPWFVRSGPYAVVCPAPFFHDELTVADGETLTLRCDVAIADGAWTEQDVEAFRAGPLEAVRSAAGSEQPRAAGAGVGA
jgi:hypothetical protein